MTMPSSCAQSAAHHFNLWNAHHEQDTIHLRGNCRIALGRIGAAELTLTGVTIERVRIFNANYQQYHAGDVEIVLAGVSTAPWPAAMRCRDQVTVTTPKANDPKRFMLEKIKTAHLYRSGVSITITDDPTKQAYPNRCSLAAIKL